MTEHTSPDPIIKQLLKNVPIFANLSDRDIQYIAQDVSLLHFRKGQTIFFQSDESTDLYIVTEGRVKASLINEDGDEFVLTVFNPRDFFGEMGLLDGTSRSATMIAAEDTSVAVLKRGQFLHALQQDPRIAINLLTVLTKRLRKSDDMLESLAFLDVGQRITKLLLETAQAEQTAGKKGTLRIQKITHKELASRTGASREAVSKALKVLAFKKIVIEDAEHFILSPDAQSFIERY